MGNCLVTKLKGTVDADLPIYGEFSFDIPANTSFSSVYLRCAGAGAVVKMTGDVEGWSYNDSRKIADAATPYTVNGTYNGEQLRIKSGSLGGRLIINNIYNQQNEESQGWFTFKPTYYNSLMCYKNWFKGNDVTVLPNGLQGTLTDIVAIAPNATIVRVSNTISGTLHDLLPLKAQIVQLNLYSQNVSTSPSDIGQFTSLEHFQCNSYIYDIANMPSIEDVARAFIANGKSTGSFSAVFQNFTLGGNLIMEGSEHPFSWTTTTVTYNGVTVNL